MATFSKVHTASRGTATYRSPEGLTINVPKSVGDQPETLEVNGLTAPVGKVKVPGALKQTPEERKAAAAAEKARFAALTPEQKNQELRNKAAKRREAAAAALRKAEERASKLSAA
jgi:hypothetical protein